MWYWPAGCPARNTPDAHQAECRGPRGGRQQDTGRPGLGVSAVRPQGLLEAEPGKGRHPSLSSGRSLPHVHAPVHAAIETPTPCPGRGPAGRAAADTSLLWASGSPVAPRRPHGAPGRTARTGPPAVRTAESGGRARHSSGPGAGRSGRPHRVLSMPHQMDTHTRNEQKCLMREYCREPGQASWRRPRPSWSQPHVTQDGASFSKPGVLSWGHFVPTQGTSGKGWRHLWLS